MEAAAAVVVSDFQHFVDRYRLQCLPRSRLFKLCRASKSPRRAAVMAGLS